MYTFDSRVRFCESDMDQKLTLIGLLDYYQDVCTLQGIDIGLSWNDLQKMGYFWVTNFWQIEVNRYPKIGEHITVGTQASDFKAFFGDRNFNMVTPEGEILSVANSVWTLLDIKTNKPVKVPEDLINIYGINGKLEMDYAPRKIKAPEGGQAQSPIEVKKMHLDYNNHVNNGKYIEIAMEYVPEKFKVTTLLAEYKNQAHLGDIIYPVVTEAIETDGRKAFYVALNDKDGKAYCIVCFKGN